MSTPTTLDALKYVCLQGTDMLDYITEQLVISRELDDDDDLIKMLDTVRENMHKALQTQVPYRLTNIPGTNPLPHSNTYEAARFYSDGTPVYSDEMRMHPINDEDGTTHLRKMPTRVWHGLPGATS